MIQIEVAMVLAVLKSR